jgi:hypothetical protein
MCDALGRGEEFPDVEYPVFEEVSDAAERDEADSDRFPAARDELLTEYAQDLLPATTLAVVEQ